MEFNDEFRNLYKLVERTASNVFLTGKAGTGKTTFLKYLRQNSCKRMVVAAPTGVAAINAGGVTLHSLFQLPFEPFVPNSFQKDTNFRFSREKQNIIRSLDLLVIDEISMVRADLLDAVDATLRHIRRNQLPFGGLQLLLIGDMQQLPPVVQPHEEELLKAHYPTSYFFDSLALKKAGFSTVELTKIYRQSDATFVDLLNAVRTNTVNATQLTVLNARYNPNFDPEVEEGYIRLTTHNNKAKLVNDQKLEALPNPSFTFTATVTGNFPESSFPTDEKLVLKKGAQVMFVKNDPSPEKAFFNGKIGVVSSLGETSITVQFPDGKTVDAPLLSWDNSQYELNEKTKAIEEKVIGTFSQFPLRLAWAITIHKSQGLTFDKVILDANSAFAHGQVYVALSRCRTLEGLVLSTQLSADAIKNDQRIQAFSDTARQQIVADEQLTVMESNYYEHLLLEQFDFSNINSILLSLSRVVSEYFSQAHLPLLHELKKQQENFQKEVVEVAAKFQAQATAYYRNRDERLQERVSKASTYFSGKLEEMVAPLLPKLKVEVTRKEVKTRYAALCEDLKLQSNVKTQTLKQAAESFTIASYLREKALALVGDDEEEQKRIRKSKSSKKKTASKEKSSEDKAPKIPTIQLSYDMYRSGKTPQQIADERGLALSTIVGHLSSYVANGTLSVTDFVPASKVEAIEQYLDSHPEVQTLTEVRAALGEDYTFSDIKMVWSLPKYRES
ncbi:MAG: helix-turn-helix domain-containing protein [Paludibacteraceae bacterium]|nr:helix-turn-helix domain-containing protein [Paludibacteraceae bacterium]